MDAETGLYYYGARYYDARTSRFISPDDRIDGLFCSAGQNMYMYCHGNPIMYSDPDGHGRKEADQEASHTVRRHGDSNGLKNDGESIDQLRKKAEARIAKYNDGGIIQNSNNCGSYSLDMTVDPRNGNNFSTNDDLDLKNFGYQPGMFSGEYYNPKPGKANFERNRKDIVRLCKADANALRNGSQKLNSVFRESDMDSTVEKGNHKVALYIDPSTGFFHWLRQDEDGMWSQKMSGQAANNIIDGKRVSDPQKVESNYKFAGIFEVGGFKNKEYDK